jgi:phosphopantothenoylcysteine decarboxylase/phosphopantothenate--cysteine ligase
MPKNIILGVTGSIAIYKACEIIRRLQDEKFLVTAVMTAEAKEFIRPALFMNLTGKPVYHRLFGETQSWGIEHVALADKADLVLIAPATANIIGKIASGICDDLLTCIVCATKAPVVICPAMNENMYKNRVLQGNIKKLKTLGYKFVEPVKGRLACNKIGVGRLAETKTIVQYVKKAL